MLAGWQTSGSVDERVPEALERKDEGRSILQRQRDLAGMNDGVDSVGGGRNPSDHHGNEEQNSDLSIRPDSGVGFHGSVAAAGIDVGIGSVGLVRRGRNSVRTFAILSARTGLFTVGPADLKRGLRGGDVACVAIWLSCSFRLLWSEALEINLVGRADC